MTDIWYIIVNPTAGNGLAKKKWNHIVSVLNSQKIQYHFDFSSYQHHEKELVHKALVNGYRKFISVGGDGTLHHIVNGVMDQKIVDPSTIKIGVIPLGTGNDWIKTYKIPKNIEKAVAIIKSEKRIAQDIGQLELLNTKQCIYFNNLAGLGFDAFVVKNNMKYKKIGALSYLISGLISFFSYQKSKLLIEFNSKIISTPSLLSLVGICKFSGGGMQLTENVDPSDGLFDITIAKNFNFFSVILNIFNFYNGTILKHKEVETYKTKHIKITAENSNTYVQADGELIGTGGFKAVLLPNALYFIIP
tara:strand:- start:291678 stop:292589 length:912 start_codon:yes stop_codon:yes gene_type:complete